jgi:cell division protein FtsB
MPRHTSREQDILIDQASSTVENIVTNLIAVVEQLDDRLSESISENDTLRATIESLERRIEELEAKQ